MIKNWLVHGDTHGQFAWMENGCLTNYKPEETAIIILGDFGVNYYLNEHDQQKKKELNSRGYTFYAVRGNHEARPADVPGMCGKWDDNVHGMIFIEDEFPNIRYFRDWGVYTINDFSVALIGGAYSVDKWWRLQRAGIRDKLHPDYTNPKKTGWFWNEQLNALEMEFAGRDFAGDVFDFVLTHTCPISWEPTDLFLSVIDQSDVDKSMEIWMDEIKDTFDWHVWLFGHYHADRLERPHVEMFFNNTDELENIYKRWEQYDKTGELDWWLPKSPHFSDKA